jgi:secreted Zn-dependent insulinase-like peptidase
MKSLHEVPAAAGVDVGAELKRFHAQYYCAQMMQLVVLGTHSLDDLQSMVVRCFSAVRSSPSGDSSISAMSDAPLALQPGKSPRSTETSVAQQIAPTVVTETVDGRSCMSLSFESAGMMMLPTLPQPLLYRLRPVRDIHRLYLTWGIPPQHSLYTSKPAEHISHLLGHEVSCTLVYIYSNSSSYSASLWLIV